MTIVKWALSNWSDQPEKKEYARETEHFYIRASKRRDAKISQYERYFDSEHEAFQFAVNRKAAKIREREIARIRLHAVEILQALECAADALYALTGEQNADIRALIAEAKGEA